MKRWFSAELISGSYGAVGLWRLTSPSGDTETFKASTFKEADDLDDKLRAAMVTLKNRSFEK